MSWYFVCLTTQNSQGTFIIKVNLQVYLQYIKSLKDLGHTIYEMGSIHQFENDYTSVIYIKNEKGQLVKNTASYSNQGDHFIDELGEFTEELLNPRSKKKTYALEQGNGSIN